MKTYVRVMNKFSDWRYRFSEKAKSRKGMELVQVGILIAIAVGIGIIFKDKIGTFVNETFSTLLGTKFS